MAYLNISGRNQLGQMTSVDLVANFILGAIVGGVVYAPQIPYLEYVGVLIIGIALLLSANYCCRRYEFLRRVVIGETIPIIKNGRFLMKNILGKRNHVDLLNIASQLNLQGILSFDDIYYAQVEPNGSVMAICDKNRLPAEIVIYAGEFRPEVLKTIHRTQDEIVADMARQGILKISDVYLGEYKNSRVQYILTNGDVLPHKTAGGADPFKDLPPKTATDGQSPPKDEKNGKTAKTDPKEPPDSRPSGNALKQKAD